MKTSLSHSSSAQHGLTLIELLIVLSIVSILLMKGVGLSMSWVHRSQVNEAITLLKNNVQQAKVLALRNTSNQPLNEATIHLCLNQQENKLYIIRPQQGSPSNVCNTAHNANTVLKTSTLAHGIYINNNQHTFYCIAFNAAGMPLSTNNTCTTSTLNFEVGKSNEKANIIIS